MGRNKSTKSALPLRSKLRKDPGIPRLPNLKVRNEQKQKANVIPAVPKDADSVMASEPTLSSLAAEAASSANDVSGEFSEGSGSTRTRTKEQIRKHYLRTLHKVIDESDVVVLVLDARDPEGCRSRLVEEEVRRREAEGKKLVFVLNKIDLVPRSNAQAWLKYLRHTTPTLPFKSATSSQRSNLSSSTAPALLKLLKAYKPKAGSITVGIVGFPNVGKSSLINSLKRSKVCAVAAQPGHTKDLQSIQLERGVKIVDSPGVVFDEDDEDNFGKGKQKSSVLLRNVVKVEDVDDPIAVVEEIVSRMSTETLQNIYGLPAFSSILEFLTMYALNNGRLLKGGTPDLTSSARQILTDWNHQKIPYYSEPPVLHPSLIPSTISGSQAIAPGAETVGQAQIVTEFSKPFSLDGLFGAADAGAFSGDTEMGDMETEVPQQAQDSMQDDSVPGITTSPSHQRKRSRSPSSIRPDDGEFQRQPKRQRKNRDLESYTDTAVDSIAKHNPLNRRSLKKDAKRARRAANRQMRIEETGMDVDDVALQSTIFV